MRFMIASLEVAAWCAMTPTGRPSSSSLIRFGWFLPIRRHCSSVSDSTSRVKASWAASNSAARWAEREPTVPAMSPIVRDVPRSSTLCPGCGLELLASGLASDPKVFASAECLQVQAEVAGFELAHPALLGRFHQLTVDAYGAQHSGGDGRGGRGAFSLAGLDTARRPGWWG